MSFIGSNVNSGEGTLLPQYDTYVGDSDGIAQPTNLLQITPTKLVSSNTLSAQIELDKLRVKLLLKLLF